MKKIDKIIKYMGETPTITIEGYTGKLSWVSRHIESDGSDYWEFVFKEEVRDIDKTIMNKIIEDRKKYMEKYLCYPKIIYLTKAELCKLNIEEHERIVREREIDLKRRLCPELLLPMRLHEEITYGCRIFGMEIKEE